MSENTENAPQTQATPNKSPSNKSGSLSNLFPAIIGGLIGIALTCIPTIVIFFILRSIEPEIFNAERTGEIVSPFTIPDNLQFVVMFLILGTIALITLFFSIGPGYAVYRFGEQTIFYGLLGAGLAILNYIVQSMLVQGLAGNALSISVDYVFWGLCGLGGGLLGVGDRRRYVFYLLGITFLPIVAIYLFFRYVVLRFLKDLIFGSGGGGGGDDAEQQRAERNAELAFLQQQSDHKERGGH